MQSTTNEQALERAIEKVLTGSCVEELKDAGTTVQQAAEKQELYRGGNGYFIGSPDDFDPKYALDTFHFWRFIERTQKEELDKLKRQSDWKLKVLERFDRMVKKYGVLRVLRKGLDVDDAHFTLMYPYPPVSAAQSLKDNFEKNEFSVTRQLRYSVDNPREEIDMVMFINGIPFATMELKNHWTGQNARLHGQNQYKFQRDNKQPLLQFGRSVVHLAVDTDEVYMTTKLNGGNTFFLPFNKGHKHGKGNPPNEKGHRSAYLWEEVLTRSSVANILQHFVRFDGKASDPLNKRNLFFPRYHQLDVVRQLVDHASKNGVGQNYLIQHSAGSGKSNSITWAAYQLIETYPVNEDIPGSKGLKDPLFNSVIVVTDRRLLDKQLRENIKEFSEVKNIVAPAYSSKDLRSSLESGKRIIITTIQKFPFIVEGITDLSDKKFAVIIDEAHSGQSGIAHGKMNEAMGGGTGDVDEEDPQELILKALRARKSRNNASYFAFTATPKESTLEKFGVLQEDGSFKPFHLYSMKQAIEEGFILDVLSNYTTLRSYYQLQKSGEENPEFNMVKAQKKLKAYVEKDEQTIATKAEIMLQHFLDNVVNTKKLKGKAKGMVVTQSIESAIKYYFAIQKLLEAVGSPFKVMVAFSGKKTLKGIEYTEESINDMPASIDTAKPTDPGYISDKIARYFNMDEYRLLVVANKYLTGFDQPKLTAMYVDKKLQKVLAVQALSRLNRSANSLGKRTEDLFVLDFFNSISDIKDAFDPFYTSTSLTEATDINVLHELKDNLDVIAVYEWNEVETFNERFFLKANGDELNSLLASSEERFNHDLELSDEQKADFKIKAKQFVKIYSQVASTIPFEKLEWEKLFWFLKFLIPKLIIKDRDEHVLDGIMDSVDFSTYGLERTQLGAKISLDASETEVGPQNPNPRGTHGDNESRDPIDVIIETFNQRWFSGWEATPEEQRVKFITIQKRIAAHPDFEFMVANNMDTENRKLAMKKILDEVMAKQRRADLNMYKMYVKDEAFQRGVINMMETMMGLRAQ